MNRSQVGTLISWSLAGCTLFIAAVNVPYVLPAMSEHLLEIGVYTLLTAFALVLSLPLKHGELSLAHAIGMIAFLALPAAVFPAMTVAIFLGGLGGGVLLTYRAWKIEGRQRRATDTRSIVYLTARVTLSFYAAGRFYLELLNGNLPLYTSANVMPFEAVLPLTIYLLVYITVYFAVFTLQTYIENPTWRGILRENRLALAFVLLLPLPFALTAASVARPSESLFFFTTTIVGAVLILFALYVMTHSEERLRRQLREMQSLSNATTAMSGKLYLDQLLKTVCTQVSQVLDIEHLTLALTHDNETRYPIARRWGVTVEQYEHPDDAALLQTVLQSRQPLLLGIHAQADRRLPAPYTAWLGVPLKVGMNQIGALAVLSSSPDRSFTEDDLRLLTIVATSASIAIESARLYTQQSQSAEQMATLNQVSGLLTGTLSPTEVLDTIVSSASMIVNTDGIAVYLLRQHGDQPLLELVRSGGLSEEFLAQQPAPLLSPSMLSGMKPVPIAVRNIKTSDLTQRLRPMLAKEGKQALVELPLAIGQTLLGVLVLYFNQVQPTLLEQLDLLQAYATQAAQAVKNAHAYESTDKALEQRVEQLASLAVLGRLMNATMRIADVYEIVLQHALEATRAVHGLILLYDANRRLQVQAHIQYPPEILHNPQLFEQGLTGRVLATGQPFRSEDTRADTAYLPLIPKTRSLLITPILKGVDVLGLILLESDELATFQESDSQFVSQIAYQAVIAADNTRLFQTVREARDNLQVILNTMEDGLLLISEHGEIALANHGMAMIGLKPDTLLGRTLPDLLNDEELHFAVRTGFTSAESVKRLLEEIRPSNQWGHHPPYTYEITTEDGNLRAVLRQMIPLRAEDAHINGVLVVFYDRTDERELLRARENFTQMMVHDLRSPLTAVTTSLRLLQELTPKDSAQRPLVDKTADASRRAVRKVLSRVDSILDIAKLESGEMYLEREPIALATLIENVRSDLEPLAQELEIQIIADLPPHLPYLHVDGDKVERTLLNLVDNALKYSPTESSVRIQVELAEREGFIRLAVIDQGPGVPPEHRARLFDRFVQVQGRQVVRRGVGLGLAFCKLVVTTHGGDIWIEDNQPQGTRFVLTLPIVPVPQMVE